MEEKKNKDVKIKLKNNLTNAMDELRAIQQYAGIDSIIQGYYEEWKEFDGNLETKMALEKRVYVVLMRLLPKLTHKQIYFGLVEDYKRILNENREILKDVAIRKEMEMNDLATFDEWFLKGEYETTIPISKSYRQYMKLRNITDNGDCIEV